MCWADLEASADVDDITVYHHRRAERKEAEGGWMGEILRVWWKETKDGEKKKKTWLGCGSSRDVVRVVKKSLGLRHHQKNKESGNFIFNLPTFYHSFPSFSIFRLDFFSFLFFFSCCCLIRVPGGSCKGRKKGAAATKHLFISLRRGGQASFWWNASNRTWWCTREPPILVRGRRAAAIVAYRKPSPQATLFLQGFFFCFSSQKASASPLERYYIVYTFIFIYIGACSAAFIRSCVERRRPLQYTFEFNLPRTTPCVFYPSSFLLFGLDKQSKRQQSNPERLSAAQGSNRTGRALSTQTALPIILCFVFFLSLPLFFFLKNKMHSIFLQYTQKRGREQSYIFGRKKGCKYMYRYLKGRWEGSEVKKGRDKSYWSLCCIRDGDIRSCCDPFRVIFFASAPNGSHWEKDRRRFEEIALSFYSPEKRRTTLHLVFDIDGSFSFLSLWCPSFSLSTVARCTIHQYEIPPLHPAVFLSLARSPAFSLTLHLFRYRR